MTRKERARKNLAQIKREIEGGNVHGDGHLYDPLEQHTEYKRAEKWIKRNPEAIKRIVDVLYEKYDKDDESYYSVRTAVEDLRWDDPPLPVETNNYAPLIARYIINKYPELAGMVEIKPLTGMRQKDKGGWHVLVVDTNTGEATSFGPYHKHIVPMMVKAVTQATADDPDLAILAVENFFAPSASKIGLQARELWCLDQAIGTE